MFKDCLNFEIFVVYVCCGDCVFVEFNDEFVGGIVMVNVVVCVGENGFVIKLMSCVKVVYLLELCNV